MAEIRQRAVGAEEHEPLVAAPSSGLHAAAAAAPPAVTTFPFSYAKVLYPLFWALGMGKARAEVAGDSVRIQMGWSFRATIPKRHIVGSTRVDDWQLSYGVHGWGGRWLVNGSSDGLVRLTIDPPAPASVLGISVDLTEVTISVQDRNGFLAAARRF